MGENIAGSVVMTVAYSIVSVMGLVDIHEAVTGREARSGRELTSNERWSRGLLGGGTFVLSILPFAPSSRAASPAVAGESAEAAAARAALQAEARASLQAAQAERRAAALSRGERQAVVREGANPSASRSAVREAIETGEINPTTGQRAGVNRPPQHHIYPQEERNWFAERGVNIDDFVVTMDEGSHQGLHYGARPGMGGGFWNETIMAAMRNAENQLGRRLTPSEIQQIGQQMMQRGLIADLPVLPYVR